VKIPGMTKKLSKVDLAHLIERVYLIPHKNVRVTRKGGRRWYVHAERTVLVADPGVPPRPYTTTVDIDGATLLEAALSNAPLRKALEMEAAAHVAAQAQHGRHVGKAA